MTDSDLDKCFNPPQRRGLLVKPNGEVEDVWISEDSAEDFRELIGSKHFGWILNKEHDLYIYYDDKSLPTAALNSIASFFAGTNLHGNTLFLGFDGVDDGISLNGKQIAVVKNCKIA